MAQAWRRPADDALVALAEDRWHALTGYAFLLAGDRAAAEDLVQEAFVRTFSRGRAVSPGALEGYVRRAVLNDAHALETLHIHSRCHRIPARSALLA